MNVSPPNPLPPPLPINPSTQEVMSLVEGGEAFNSGELTSAVSSVSAQGPALLRTLNGISSLLGVTFPGGGVTADRMQSSVSNFSSHVGSQFGNLSNNLNISSSAQSLANSRQGGGGGGDMCANVGSLFGSIMGGGMQQMGSMGSILQNIGGVNDDIGGQALRQINQTLQAVRSGNTSALPTSAITAATSLLGEGITGFGSIDDLITKAGSLAGSPLQAMLGPMLGPLSQSLSQVAAPLMQGLQSGMAAIEGMIGSEVAGLAGAVSALLSQASAGNLLSIFNHPCANMVLNAVGTPKLLGALGGRR